MNLPCEPVMDNKVDPKD